MDEAEKKCLADVEKYGFHVIHVMAEESLPPFSYSVGIERSSGAPEIIVIGLKQTLGHFIVNEYNTRIRGGERLQVGTRVAGFIEGFDCEVRAVDPSHYQNYVGWNLWFYEGAGFQVLQLVFPTTAGVWPWDDEADISFKDWQPLLDAPA